MASAAIIVAILGVALFLRFITAHYAGGLLFLDETLTFPSTPLDHLLETDSRTLLFLQILRAKAKTIVA